VVLLAQNHADVCSLTINVFEINPMQMATELLLQIGRGLHLLCNIKQTQRC